MNTSKTSSDEISLSRCLRNFSAAIEIDFKRAKAVLLFERVRVIIYGNGAFLTRSDVKLREKKGGITNS